MKIINILFGEDLMWGVKNAGLVTLVVGALNYDDPYVWLSMTVQFTYALFAGANLVRLKKRIAHAIGANNLSSWFVGVVATASFNASLVAVIQWYVGTSNLLLTVVTIWTLSICGLSFVAYFEKKKSNRP